MNQNKKGMEMSMNVIIVAVISLLVLVILVYLMANQTNIFGKEKACFERGGTCEPRGSVTDRSVLQPEDSNKPLCSNRNEECYKLTPG